MSGRESGHFKGLRRHFRAAGQGRRARLRPRRRLHPTYRGRMPFTPRPNRSAATGGSVASGGALRNAADNSGLSFRLRCKNEYRTNSLPWQEIVADPLGASPLSSWAAGRAPCLLPLSVFRGPAQQIRRVQDHPVLCAACGL